jgi:16S rRNA (uracil1498-N3)-methyltransferase
MARRRFFVDQIRNGIAAIEGPEAHHLTRVLRVEEGQQFEISDDRKVYLAQVTEARKSVVLFQVVSELEPGPPTPPLVLVCALIKFDRFEWMIEKATELGVREIVPVETERVEHGLMRAAGKRVERWRRIALEASQQSRRSFLPVIADPCRLQDQLTRPDAIKMRLDELAGTPALRVAPEWRTGDLALAIGPEGGWTDRERGLFDAAGWPAASLGATVLRAETAAIAALAVAAHAWLGNTEV